MHGACIRGLQLVSEGPREALAHGFCSLHEGLLCHCESLTKYAAGIRVQFSLRWKSKCHPYKAAGLGLFGQARFFLLQLRTLSFQRSLCSGFEFLDFNSLRRQVFLPDKTRSISTSEHFDGLRSRLASTAEALGLDLLFLLCQHGSCPLRRAISWAKGSRFAAKVPLKLLLLLLDDCSLSSKRRGHSSQLLLLASHAQKV